MDFQAIHEDCHNEGHAAAMACQPVPMQIGGEVINDGVCGFASVRFKGNTAWGRWAKKMGVARPAYPNGLCIWVGAYNQSMARKEAYARAYAQALTRNLPKVSAWCESRMD